MQTPCTHPPARLFAWFAYDGTVAPTSARLAATVATC